MSLQLQSFHEFSDSLSSGSQTIDRKKQGKTRKQSKTKRFTLHGKSRKKSRQVLMTMGGAAEEEMPSGNDKTGYHYHQNAFSSDESSLMTSLNWSVPSDLPAVIKQHLPSVPSGPTSLENLSIMLESEDTNLDRMRCASNPDIIDERRRSRRIRPRIPAEFCSVSDIHRSPGSAGPRTCDVSVQVDSKQVFTFPTPPNSVSPTLPLELSQLTSPHHHGLLYPQKHCASNPARILDQHGHEQLGHHSSSHTLDNRHSSGSFPFVPEEDELQTFDEDQKQEKVTRKKSKIVSSTATAVIQEEEVHIYDTIVFQKCYNNCFVILLIRTLNH